MAGRVLAVLVKRLIRLRVHELGVLVHHLVNLRVPPRCMPFLEQDGFLEILRIGIGVQAKQVDLVLRLRKRLRL